MGKVVALAGLGDEVTTPAPSPRAMLAWGLVLGATLGIFVGTLMLNPSRKKKA